LRETIERHLADALGYEVATFLRTPAQLAKIAAADSTADQADGSSASSLYVAFLHEPAPEALRSDLRGLESDMDEFHFAETEIYWRIQGKLSESPLFGGGMDRVTRTTPMTMRNMNSLRRLVAKADVSPS
jgi:uncharacterized protein (DUF1697 family)